MKLNKRNYDTVGSFYSSRIRRLDKTDKNHYRVHSMNNSGPDRDNDITLRILDEISQESSITQRTLSGRLNIALGLVNTYIKRLAKKGHIKISKGPMNRVKYALTRKGFTHRVSLTYNYMQSSINYFKNARQRIDNIYALMITAGVKNILIWGDGEVAELSYISLRGLPLKLVGVVDGKSRDGDFFGHDIYSFEDVPKLDYDAILIASFNKKEIQQLSDLGIDKQKVYSL
jgi:DNA-binding MarR family transcriptional regulator